MARSSLNSALYIYTRSVVGSIGLVQNVFFTAKARLCQNLTKSVAQKTKQTLTRDCVSVIKPLLNLLVEKRGFWWGGGQVHGLGILRAFLPESLPGWSSRLTQSSACPAATNTSQQVKETIAGIEDGYKYRRESKGPHCCLGGRIDPNSLPRKLFCNRMIWTKGWIRPIL